MPTTPRVQCQAVIEHTQDRVFVRLEFYQNDRVIPSGAFMLLPTTWEWLQEKLDGEFDLEVIELEIEG